MFRCYYIAMMVLARHLVRHVAIEEQFGHDTRALCGAREKCTLSAQPQAAAASPASRLGHACSAVTNSHNSRQSAFTFAGHFRCPTTFRHIRYVEKRVRSSSLRASAPAFPPLSCFSLWHVVHGDCLCLLPTNITTFSTTTMPARPAGLLLFLRECYDASAT